MSLVAYETSEDSEEEKIEDVSEKQPADRLISKKRETVKITIPSLKEFKDEEIDTKPKKKIFSQSGSGLFSILPPPKNSTSMLCKPGFTPYVLSKKKESAAKEANHVKKCTTYPNSENNSSTLKETQTCIESKNKDIDFFSLTEEEIDSKNISDPAIEQYSRSNSFIESSEKIPLYDSTDLPTNTLNCGDIPLPGSSEVYYPNDPANSSIQNEQSDEALLNEDVLLKLQGRRKEFESVNIIDVNADDQLSDKNEWLMKNLTQETEHRPSKRKHDMPTQQQKRKHQITYLAFQAKEREMDLKNQWAMNSRTRRETQAKYGF